MQLLEGRVGAQSILAVMMAVYCRPKLSLHTHAPHAPHATNTLPDPIDSADFGDTHRNKQVVSHERGERHVSAFEVENGKLQGTSS
jgi:hypothetical protein